MRSIYRQQRISYELILFILLIYFSFATPSYSQLGAIDLNFNAFDKGNGSGFGVLGLNDFAIGPNDQIILLVDSYNEIRVPGIVLINKDGQIDNSFDPGVGFSSTNSANIVRFLQKGKIIVAGTFEKYQNKTASKLVVINKDGSIDSGFKTDGFPTNAYIYDIQEQADGKIIVAGTFDSYAGVERNNILRLNSDGTLDMSFDPGSGFNGTTTQAAIQKDGKILVGGNFFTFNNMTKYLIVRLNDDGTIDESFNIDEGIQGFVEVVRIQKDGKILVSGNIMLSEDAPMISVMRLETDGTLDHSLNITGPGISDVIYDMLPLEDNTIILIGNLSKYSNRLVKIDEYGNLDPSFKLAEIQGVSFLKLFSNGQLLIGDVSSYNNKPLEFIARLNTDGSLDHTFNLNTGFNGVVNEIDSFEDGSILAAGEFTVFNQTDVNGFVKLKQDGSFDSDFNYGAGFNGHINDIISYPGNKMLIAGDFTSYNNIPVKSLVMLNSDGTLFDGFTLTDPTIQSVSEVVVQPDGKLLVAHGKGISRLLSDGSIDPDFFVNEFDVNVQHIALLKNGSIIISGRFYFINKIKRRSLARLNSDGTLDLSFDPKAGISTNPDHSGEIIIEVNLSINEIAVQSDGKILVAGHILYYNGISVYSFFRVNTDGSLDTEFQSNKRYLTPIADIQVLKDDRIIVVGDKFANGVDMLEKDGKHKESLGNSINGYVEKIAFHKDGSFLLAGRFTKLKDVGKNCLTKMFIHEINISNWEFDNVCSGSEIDLSINATGTYANKFIVELSNESGTFETPYQLATLDQNELGNIQLKLPSGIPSGSYFLRLKSNSPDLINVDPFTLEVMAIDTAITLTGTTITAIQEDASYQWFDCNNNFNSLLNSTSRTFDLTMPGSYAVQITRQGCIDTSRCVEFNPEITGSKPEAGIEMKVYPNPFISDISISGNLENIFLKVYNINGKEIYTSTELKGNIYKVNLENYPPGIYLIRVSEGNTILSKDYTIIKQ